MGRAESSSVKYRETKLGLCIFTFNWSAYIKSYFQQEMLTWALLLVSLGLAAPQPAREGRVIGSGSDGATWGEECGNPCSGEKCDKVAKMMEHLVDFSVDPCDDFFAFSCSAKTRGTKGPFPRKVIDEKEDLLKFPPKKFDYMKKFYLSCTKINTGFTTEEVFERCVQPDGPGGERCTKEELEEYGDIYVQMVDYIQKLFKYTAFPAVTSDWDEASKDWFGGRGWTWDGVAAVVLKDYFYLGAYNQRQTFKSNVFFAPLINSVSMKGEDEDDTHEIYIVPMTISSRLGRLTSDPGYKKLMVNVLKSFGGNASTIEADASKILEMEKQLVEIGLPSSLSAGDFRHLTVRELADSVPIVQWTSYIEAALDHNPSVKIRPSTRVYVPDISKMEALGRLVENLSVRDRANLLVWRMFIKFANDFLNTGSESGDLQENPWHGRTRKERCLNQIDAFFPNAYNDLTIAENVDEKTTKGIKTMFQNLQREFENIIDDQAWMSRATKKSAKDKVKAMKINVGERTPNTREYKRLTKKMVSNDYIGNILEIGNYQFDSLVKKWEEPVKDEEEAEQVMNAYYFQERNEMTILTGLIHGFFGIGLDFDIPAGLLHGGFSALGHEMVHGFDNTGRLFDKDGLRFDWWKPSEVTEYDKRTQCLVEQYQNFSISYEGEDYSQPWPAPAGENIADNGGALAVYETYERLPEAEKQCVPGFNFTSDQLFWLGYSFYWCTLDGRHENIRDYRHILRDSPSFYGHFPEPWRVNTVFSNLPQFAEAFQCPQGSRLNPPQEEQCAVWSVPQET